MDSEKFTRREVQRAFRDFKDLLDDAIRSEPGVWEDAFRRLLHHCQNNSVMKVITEPLRTNPNVDVRQLDPAYNDPKWTHTARYRLPDDEEDRTALLYQFFLSICAEGKDLYDQVFQLSMHAYSKGHDDKVVSTFNKELVAKFGRAVSYRLDEVIEDIGNATEVTRAAMIVFHHHDHSHHHNSMNIGNIQGSNVAISGSTVSDSTATFNSNAELAEALKALKPLVGEVAAEQRQAVESALDTLVEATRMDIPVAQVAQVAHEVEVVAKSSPTLRERIKEIAGKMGVSLASSTLFQAIKMALGIH